MHSLVPSHSLGSERTLMLTGMQLKLKEVSSYIHVGKNITTQTPVWGYLVI